MNECNVEMPLFLLKLNNMTFLKSECQSHMINWYVCKYITNGITCICINHFNARVKSKLAKGCIAKLLE